VSVAETVARVAHLQALMGAGPTAAPATTTQSTSGTSSDFAARLAAVGTPGATTAATATPATGATGATGASGSGAKTPYAAEIDAAAAKYNLDPALLRALIRQESNFNPNAGSPAGARGLTQLMPGTAAALGVDPSVPAQAIEGGAKYLRQQLDKFGNKPELALAAYNAGPGAVQRFGGIPPYAETQNYVRKVMAYAAEYRQAGASASASPVAAAAAVPAAALAAPAAALPAAPTTVPATTTGLPYSTT